MFIRMNNYLSVSEYAKLTMKDSGNIRRLLASGRLKGQKVGNQWIIPKNAKYPEDKRETNGEYKNWRKRVALNKNKDLMSTVTKMVSSLRTIYANSLLEVILYGSYARGTQTKESDVDIALILQERPSSEVTNSMIECVASYELESGKVLSVIDIDHKKYNQWKNSLPFYKNIQKEGIVLWKTKE